MRDYNLKTTQQNTLIIYSGTKNLCSEFLIHIPTTKLLAYLYITIIYSCNDTTKMFGVLLLKVITWLSFSNCMSEKLIFNKWIRLKTLNYISSTEYGRRLFFLFKSSVVVHETSGTNNNILLYANVVYCIQQYYSDQPLQNQFCCLILDQLNTISYKVYLHAQKYFNKRVQKLSYTN